MSDNQKLEEMMLEIKVDLAGLKTDVKWLKKLFTVIIVAVGLVFGIDMSAIMV